MISSTKARGTSPTTKGASSPKHRLAAAGAALALLLAGCTSDGSGDEAKTPSTDLSGNDIILTSALSTVGSCDELLSRLKAEGTERVGPYGFGNGGPIGIMEGDTDDTDMADEMMEAADAPVGRSSESTSASLDSEFSGTNAQEQGVDEADLVKTDGKRLVTVANQYLQVIDITGNTPNLERKIKLPDEIWQGELFLNGDTALLMTTGWTEQPFAAQRTADMSWYPGTQTGRLIEIDLVEGKIGRSFEFEGGYLSAREIDGTIRIVLTADANRFNFLFPSNDGAADSAKKANQDIIADSTIDQWIPTYRITDGGPDNVVEEGPIVECDQVHLPSEFAGFGSVVVLTVDLNDGFNINDSLSIFTDAQTVYASTDRLVVATPRWPEWDPETGEAMESGDDYRTALHTFDITDPTRAGYVASGSVIGHLLSQYSLSEYEGHLRAATTAGGFWSTENSESFVTVFEENGESLDAVGQVGGLGRGERIFAVRFLGNKGYVVTFEQIDPLYVVDLADPTNPEVKGELKIPGFSSYLHPLDENTLLGVGTDGDDDGRTSGAVLSLFDVSDPSDPQRIDKFALANLPEGLDGSSYSLVANDPRAFTSWDDNAIIPVGWWGYSEQSQSEATGSAAVLVTIDGGKITERGRVGHPANRECEGGFPMPVEEGAATESVDPATETDAEEPPADEDAEADFARDETTPVEPFPPGEEFCFSFQPEIQRTVVVGDTLYSISYEGVAAHNFDSLESTAWIPFEQR